MRAVGGAVVGIAALALAVVQIPSATRQEPCEIQIEKCLDNPWQPDWNVETYGPRKDCTACLFECRHNNGVWPYYKCPK